MDSEEYKALLERQAKERAELLENLAKTLEARIKTAVGGSMGPTIKGDELTKKLTEQRVRSDFIDWHNMKVAELDKRHAAERATAAPEFDKDEEKSVDMTKLQKAAIALALTKGKQPEQGADKEAAPAQEFNKAAKAPGPTKDFNQQAERD